MVTLATTHVALADLPRALTPRRIQDSLELLAIHLETVEGLVRPRIAVCGLNPHAGEGGYLGGEERDVIIPALASARVGNAHVTGPHPADAAFAAAVQGQYDAVLAMYHDQGLAPVKALARGRSVNVTLGLPFVRTSPDHGTAFDIAGQGRADPSSFGAAFDLALTLASRRRHRSSP
jgi:4-hydroxythreonine-4-phosphate dehydrogenase